MKNLPKPKCPECNKEMVLDKVIWGDYKYYCKDCEELYELDFEDYIETNARKRVGIFDNTKDL